MLNIMRKDSMYIPKAALKANTYSAEEKLKMVFVIKHTWLRSNFKRTNSIAKPAQTKMNKSLLCI